MSEAEPEAVDKTCRDCAMSIPSAAWKCPYCQEWQEVTMRKIKSDVAAAGIIALLSLLVPGLGHLVMGMYGTGFLWLVSCVGFYRWALMHPHQPFVGFWQAYLPYLIAPMVLHLFAVVTAGRAAASR